MHELNLGWSGPRNLQCTISLKREKINCKMYDQNAYDRPDSQSWALVLFLFVLIREDRMSLSVDKLTLQAYYCYFKIYLLKLTSSFECPG